MAVHVDINPDFNDRAVMASANDLKRNVERVGNETGDAWARGFERAGPKIQKAYEQAYAGASNAASKLRSEEAKLSDVRDKAQRSAEELAKAEAKVTDYRTRMPNLTATIAAEEKKLDDIRQRHNSTLAELTVRTESATRAFTNQSSAISDLGRAFTDVERGASGLSESADGLGSSLGRLGPALAAGVAVGASALSGLVEVAASASQALIALPAAAGAAGAAFGTLKLATLGFDDALKAIGDPKKFNEALKGLAPDAQQAALAIATLMPEFEHLKDATQGAFFANVAPQLKNLTDELLPMVQQTTTGIAQAFNAAFQGAATQLQAPETKAALDSFGQNVTRAFQELAPAVAPLTKAMGELLSVGSSALPQIAVAATNAATAFSNFITEANSSGELKRMLDGGLNTLEQLVPVAMNFGKAFLSLAPVGEQILPKVVDALNTTAAVLPDIIKVAGGGGQVFQTWSDALKDVDPLLKAIDLTFGRIDAKLPGINQSISDLINPLHIIAEIIKGIEWFFNPGGRDNPMRDQAEKALYDRRAQLGLPPTSVGGSGSSIPLPAGASYGGLGTSALAPAPAGPSWSGGTPNPFATTPSASSSGPKLPTAPVTPYDSSLPAGFAGLPQTAAMLSAQSSYMDANTNLAEKKARLNQLENTNTATATDIQKARNDVITSEHTQQEAELRLYDARNQMNEKAAKQAQGFANQMGEFGVKLDQDLGISKGLAGIADNLVRFVGSLALAPMEAKLNAISNAPGQAQGGFGILGMMGAQGAFGAQYTAAGQAASNGGNAASALGPAGLMPGVPVAAGSYGVPGGSNVYSGAHTEDTHGELVPRAAALKNLIQQTFGVKDIGGYRAPDGYNEHSSGEALDIMVGGNKQLGDQINQFLLQNASALGVKYDLWQQTQWNPNGSTSPMEDRGGATANHRDHVHARVLPGPIGGGPDISGAPVLVGASSAPLGGGGGQTAGGAMPASSGLSGLPLPLPVTIVGGMGIGGPALDGGLGAPVPGPGGPTLGPGGGATPFDIGPGLGGPPAAPAPGGPGWGLGGLPQMPAGAGGGRGYGPGAPGAGMAGRGAGTQIGAAVAPAGGTGKGGIGASDSTMALAGMAASALDVMAPGAGQAAQTVMKLANRAVQYGGQVAGIGIQGLQQTFLPTGGSELANNSWASKLIGGLAGAAPALPNMAGKPAAPAAQQGGQNGQQGGGDTHNNVTVNNQRQTEDGTGKDVAWNLQNMYQPAGGK